MLEGYAGYENPTLMSRGYGRIQRAILEAVHEAGEATDYSGLPEGTTIRRLAWRIHGTALPTPAQHESIRRAIHRLRELGEVEIAYSGNPLRVRRRPTEAEREAHRQWNEASRQRFAERVASILGQ